MKLECKNLRKSYGNKVALKEFSLYMEPGIYGLLGENGAGKSTLMNLLTDNLKRDSGEILWNGKDILTWKSKYRKEIGYMPQQQGFYPEFSALSYLIYIGKLKNMKHKQAKIQAMELLERLNLLNMAHEKIESMSGGMRQRVMLAQALMGDAHILILDEPTVGLDPKERIRMRNFLMEISKDRIILLATHVVSDVECIADYVLLMKQGELVASGSPDELIRTMDGHVVEKTCKKEDIIALSKQYPTGNAVQKKDGIVMRVVGNEFEEDYIYVKDSWNLEDVYLYYCANAGNDVVQ